MKRLILLAAATAALALAASLHAQPQFLYQPQSESPSPGADVFFYAPAFGASQIDYQWLKNGQPIPGATLELLVFSPVSTADAGDYALIATDYFGAATSQVATLVVNPDFVKITTGALVNDQGTALGAAWADYDGDSWLDVFIPHNGQTNNALFHNNGDGSFSKAPMPAASAAGSSAAIGAGWGDIDNDGRPDLHVSNDSNQNDFLYKNRGGGLFERLLNIAPVQDGASTYGGAWADFDHDGWLDLAVINFPLYNGYTLTPINYLYHNNHDGTFRSITNPLPSLGFAVQSAPVAVDFDNDRWPDLFTTGMYIGGYGLFRNLGDNQFATVDGPWRLLNEGALSAAWGDYDNDGFLDVFVPAGFTAGANSLSLLCHNNGGTSFSSVTNGEIAAWLGQPSGVAWADYDNDGWLDLFLSDIQGQNRLFHNNGDGSFSAVTTGSPVTDHAASYGCTWADYDNDGFPDLMVLNADRGHYLYRNAGNSNAWIKIRCEGQASNRMGVGAKVRLLSSPIGVPIWQTREISTGNTAGGAAWTADFGLGLATEAAVVRVEWPSGADTVITHAAARQTLTLVEPLWVVLPRNPGAGLGRPFVFTCEGPAPGGLLPQWLFNGADIPGATNATLSIPSVSTNDLGAYAIAFRNPATGESFVSAPRALRIAPLPVISPQPQPAWQTLSLGNNVAYLTGVSSLEPCSIQWCQNGLPIPGATNATLAFLPLQAGNGGDFFLVASNASGSVTSSVASIALDAAFTKILNQPMLTNSGSVYGSAWIDLPGQPCPALLVNHYNGVTNALFRHDGASQFTRLYAPEAGALPTASAQCGGTAVADYNNDGFQDVFIANNSGRGSYLYQGAPDGLFLRVTNNPAATNLARSGSAAWADYDRDGWLDLFVSSTANDSLFRNTTNGFVPVTNVLTLDGTASRGCAWADYDADGWPDLFVAIGGVNCLYHNNRDGSFTSMTNSAVAAAKGTSYSAAWGDYDNDGRLDLFVAGTGPDFLFHNNGDGDFTRITTGPVVASGSNSYACAWVDYDNDGWLDLYVANAGADFLFHNDHDGVFSRVLLGNPPNDGGDSRSCAWGDYDNDGFPDLFVGNSSGERFLYRNSGNTNHWLKIRCAGVQSNRGGVGVKVRLQALIGGAWVSQMREITTGDGLGGGALSALFGLGDASEALSLRLEWPSGVVQEFQNVPACQSLTVLETQTSLDPMPRLARPVMTAEGVRFDLVGGTGAPCLLQTSADLRHWDDWTTLTNRQRPLPVLWSNTLAAPKLFFRTIQQ